MVEIIKVESKKELRQFIDLSHDLYEGDPNYVPELFLEQKKLFNKKKNPFFLHSKADFFLAKKEGSLCGRIAAIKNNNYLKFTGDDSGFFGFFLCINDQEVANALFNTVKDWIKAEGLGKMTGPESYTVSESCGILTDGFDHAPTIGMPYNKPYYEKLLQDFGFQVCMELNAYSINSYEIPPQGIRSKEIGERLLIRNQITIRPINMKDFDAEIGRFHKNYNEAFKDNWGFVPLTAEEFKFQAEGLKDIADPDIVLFAEKEGEVVAFILTLPDYNQVFKRIKRGRLFPFGIFKLLKYRKKIDGCRISILGIQEEFRNKGIAPVFYGRIFEESHKKGLCKGEASYVMANNKVMNKNMKFMGGEITKKYKLYEISI